MASARFFQALFLAFMVLNSQVFGQITTPCTAPVQNLFAPCMNFLMNSSGNGTSPTAACCNTLKGLTGNGFDCLCLLLTASVPFQLPINRTIAASLPRACNMPGVPVQCKAAAGSPLPAPGPAGFAPTQSPAGSVVPGAVSPTLAPSSDIPTTTTPPADSNTPAIRPATTPSSAASPLTSFSPAFILLALGAIVMKLF